MRLLPERIGIVEQGEIEFEGQELLALPENEMREIRGEKIAMIFQDPMTSLNPVFTVGSQLIEAILLDTDKNKKEAQDFRDPAPFCQLYSAEN